jgi:riboflavin biosynthesis pyrimidine reductase
MSGSCQVVTNDSYHRTMRRLGFHPDRPAGAVTVREAYDVPRGRVHDRPWVGLCMVSSLDGSTVVEQRSAGLSSPADVEVLHTLRAIADVIVVGAATVRIEGYHAPAKRGQRVGVVSRSGRVDTTTELFTSGSGFLIVPEDAPPASVPTIRAGVGTLDLPAALAQLDAEFVQCEGGATLNAAMFAADLIDELNLTISPLVAGGTGPRVTAGAPDLAHRFDVAHVLEDDGFLFTRYVRRR